jgi:hypothetical protein
MNGSASREKSHEKLGGLIPDQPMNRDRATERSNGKKEAEDDAARAQEISRRTET